MRKARIEKTSAKNACGRRPCYLRAWNKLFFKYLSVHRGPLPLPPLLLFTPPPCFLFYAHTLCRRLDTPLLSWSSNKAFNMSFSKYKILFYKAIFMILFYKYRIVQMAIFHQLFIFLSYSNNLLIYHKLSEIRECTFGFVWNILSETGPTHYLFIISIVNSTIQLLFSVSAMGSFLINKRSIANECLLIPNCPRDYLETWLLYSSSTASSAIFTNIHKKAFMILVMSMKINNYKNKVNMQNLKEIGRPFSRIEAKHKVFLEAFWIYP